MHAVDFEEVYKDNLKKRILSTSNAEIVEKLAKPTSLRKKENKQYKELIAGASNFMKNHNIESIRIQTTYGKCVLKQDGNVVYQSKRENFSRYNGPVENPNCLRKILAEETEARLGYSIEDILVLTYFNEDIEKKMKEQIETLVNTEIKKYARNGYKN